MAAEGERPESTSTGHTDESAHITIGGGAWQPIPAPRTDEAAGALLDVLTKVRSDLTLLRDSDELIALRDQCDAAVDEISRTGHVTLDLVALLRDRLAAAEPVRALASGAALALALDRVEDGLRTLRPAEKPKRTWPAGHARPGGYGTPAGHTPPGPSTGSDDDEWPDPADG
ncbi:hypothetical protein ADK65_01640 [Streptomyces sp. NRRL B-1140]|uniref:hypothetical protein n=1 Tax=Streptomyces sp. NRRL B-1140 TaxID=1415549 RepID=UPI0006AFE517|nr:hypothetical protein [Streptomyces sp. NRRL B-1140]KOX06466.1 hypothetical protein ADK65_01640 [Streptomyces sp. NRRL B-1140]